MHLIGQTILCCRVKGCPSHGKKSLKILIKKHEKTPREFKKVLAEKLLKIVDYELVLALAEFMGIKIPASKADVKEEELPKVFELMVGVDIVDGDLECPDCHRKFPILDGIPNLILEDKEI